MDKRRATKRRKIYTRNIRKTIGNTVKTDAHQRDIIQEGEIESTHGQLSEQNLQTVYHVHEESGLKQSDNAIVGDTINMEYSTIKVRRKLKALKSTSNSDINSFMNKSKGNSRYEDNSVYNANLFEEFKRELQS